jgi:hypothetical protein
VIAAHAPLRRRVSGNPFNSMPMMVIISLSSDVIGKGANIDLFTEACSIGLCFECLGLITKLLVALVVFPFGLCWQWFANVWPATELEAQFCGSEAFAGGGNLCVRPRVIGAARPYRGGPTMSERAVEEGRSVVAGGLA